jgi:hypothetical protein
MIVYVINPTNSGSFQLMEFNQIPPELIQLILVHPVDGIQPDSTRINPVNSG